VVRGVGVIECRKEPAYRTGDSLYIIDTSKDMQQIVFRFLGPPEISYKGLLIKIPRRRSRALLYYLVSTQSPQPRERLLTLLCGDVDEESARNTFKTLLAEVRSLLRSFDSAIEWIINDGDQLRLNPHAPLWLDTEIFEKMTAGTSRNLNQAIDLYRGSFLDGFFLKDAPDFDAWVRSARDHFHRLYIKALRKLAEVYESENQFEQAISCVQMLLTADPLLEEAYARLMRLYWKPCGKSAIRSSFTWCSRLRMSACQSSTISGCSSIISRHAPFRRGPPPGYSTWQRCSSVRRRRLKRARARYGRAQASQKSGAAPGCRPRAPSFHSLAAPQ
jgi:DNA-binding SARP family transcriptional activator